jgi:hypothetical protein
MKLIDFFNFEPLNRVKDEMGIPRDVYGSFTIALDEHRLTREELEKLTSGEGIDVSFNELTVLHDGTLAYKDSRVLLYIRDVNEYGRTTREPRYHLAHCSTLQEMQSRGRFERYVIAAEITGTFQLNIITRQGRRSERRRLHVCQNCLTEIGFDDFSRDDDRDQRHRYVAAFTPDRFFEVYPRSLHVRKPAHTEQTAPLNDYTPDFREISASLRRQAGWRCQDCQRVFADMRLRRYVHVHHRNGIKSDNSRQNLQVLCLGCHAETPNHSHMKQHRDYLAFLAERPPG